MASAIAIPKIEFPHIWVPKWRGLARLLHLRKHPGSGHMMKNAGGHLLNNCQEYGSPCGPCPDITPASLSLTFSGISHCAAQGECWNVVATRSYKWITRPTMIDGSYILTQSSSNPCLWEYDQDLESSVHLHHYFGSIDCTEPPFQEFDYTRTYMYVQSYTAGHIHIFAAWSLPDTDVNYKAPFRRNSVAVTGDGCVDGVYNNGYTAGQCNVQALCGGTGGTVTIVEL